MTLMTEEFMRRFLLHVLPSGFHRIRHYGLLAKANRKAAPLWRSHDPFDRSALQHLFVQIPIASRRR
jgi:hypothetical protein